MLEEVNQLFSPISYSTLPLVKSEGHIADFDLFPLSTECSVNTNASLCKQGIDPETNQTLHMIRKLEMPGTNPLATEEWSKYRNHPENISTYPETNRYGQHLMSLQNYFPKEKGGLNCKMCNNTIPEQERNRDYKGSCGDCIRKDCIWYCPPTSSTSAYVFKHCQGCRKMEHISFFKPFNAGRCQKKAQKTASQKRKRDALLKLDEKEATHRQNCSKLKLTLSDICRNQGALEKADALASDVYKVLTKYGLHGK